MLPAPAPVIRARDDRLDPLIQAQTAAHGRLPRKQFHRIVEADVVVVRQYCRDGGVEHGEQAQACADAIWAVPERGGSEEVRGEEGEVVGVSEGGQERGCGSEDAGAVSWMRWRMVRERTVACLLGRCRLAVRGAVSRGGGRPASCLPCRIDGGVYARGCCG